MGRLSRRNSSTFERRPSQRWELELYPQQIDQTWEGLRLQTTTFRYGPRQSHAQREQMRNERRQEIREQQRAAQVIPHNPSNKQLPNKPSILQMNNNVSKSTLQTTVPVATPQTPPRTAPTTTASSPATSANTRVWFLSGRQRRRHRERVGDSVR